MRRRSKKRSQVRVFSGMEGDWLGEGEAVEVEACLAVMVMHGAEELCGGILATIDGRGLWRCSRACFNGGAAVLNGDCGGLEA